MPDESLSELRARAENLRLRNAEEAVAFRRHNARQEEALRTRHTAEEEALSRKIAAKAESERRQRLEHEEALRSREAAEKVETLTARRDEERDHRRAWEITRHYIDIMAPVVSSRFHESRRRPQRIGGPASKPGWIVPVRDDVPDGMASEMRLAFHRDGTWSLVGERDGGRPALVRPDAPLRMGLRQGFVYDTRGVRTMAEVVYSIHPLELRSTIFEHTA